MSTIDSIVLALVAGHALPDAPEDQIAEARHRIAVAADYDRRAELGLAIRRLNDIYAHSMAGSFMEPKTALAAQRELNRLLRLYEAAQTPQADQQGSEAQRELAAVAEHLLPLNLAKPEYPLSGHARIAADLLRQHGLPNTEAT